MYDRNRLSEEYLNGVEEFMRAAEEDKLRRMRDYIHYPCKDCENVHILDNLEQVKGHLIRRGFMDRYTCWTSHGEEERLSEGGNDEIVEADYVASDSNSDEETSSDDPDPLQSMLHDR